MIIHFTASRSSVVNDFATLKKVIAVINKTGNMLARDWMEPQHHTEAAKTVVGLGSKDVFKLSIDAIERADAVIIETSEKSFGSGFQAATALFMKKPTLLLIRKDYVHEESKISQGIENPLLFRKEYSNDSELEAAVASFIKDNTVKVKDLRFNFVIDHQLYNHIRWKSFKTKKTKAEVVRELLYKDMDKDT